MNKTISILSLMLITPMAMANPLGNYDVSDKHPFGRLNPEALDQIAEYKGLIGLHSCQSTGRNTDGSWQKPVNMKWQFKYIMNGHAVQDETYRDNGSTSGSIRQFDNKSGQWFVHYYSSLQTNAPLSFWAGGLKKDRLVLTRQQKSFDGKDGYTRLTFHDIKPMRFQWLMEWMSKDKKSVVYAIRKISCKRVD